MVCVVRRGQHVLRVIIVQLLVKEKRVAVECDVLLYTFATAEIVTTFTFVFFLGLENK